MNADFVAALSGWQIKCTVCLGRGKVAAVRDQEPTQRKRLEAPKGGGWL